MTKEKCTMCAKAATPARYLLGLLFLVFGTNGLVMITTGSGFLPMPPSNPQMQAVMGGLFSAVYLMPLVKLLQVVSAIFLLMNRRVNLALVLLAPIVVNILGMHLFVDLGGAPVAILITVLYLTVLKSRWEAFKPLFACK